MASTAKGTLRDERFINVQSRMKPNDSSVPHRPSVNDNAILTRVAKHLARHALRVDGDNDPSAPAITTQLIGSVPRGGRGTRNFAPALQDRVEEPRTDNAYPIQLNFPEVSVMSLPFEIPSHLTEETLRWWESVVDNYELEEHHVRLLTLAGEAWDRAQHARETLEREGPYYVNRFSEPRAHPAIAVERDNRLQFARLMRELDLDGSPQPGSRPPRIPGRYA